VAGLCSGGLPPAFAAIGNAAMAGPGATTRAEVAMPAPAGGRRIRCATAGVTPAVAALGRTGSWPMTGRACASCCGVARCPNRWIGWEAASALAGATVAPPRLAKLLTVTFWLIVVMFVTLGFTLRM
jgi:hypothetical protein